MQQLFAGVDGGGSKTTAVIVNEAGEELGRATTGPSNYQVVGLETALLRVREALATARQATGLPVSESGREKERGIQLSAVVLGLAGLARPDDRARWQHLLEQDRPLADRVELNSDADLILYGLPQHTGLGIIAGTGTIALGRDQKGNMARAGGWGHFFGDEGSGLWLGREALRAAARMADGRGPETTLLPRILEELELTEASELVGAIYGSLSAGAAGPGQAQGINNAMVAGLARLVIQSAGEGDTIARNLLMSASDELVIALKACASRLSFSNSPSLAVAGGLLLNNPAYLAEFERRIRQEIALSESELVRVEDPALAAARAARWIYFPK